MSAAQAPRAAATLVVVRDAAVGVEVLLMRRAERGDHNSGAWVFPGGLVDPGDGQADVSVDGLDDAAASAQLGLERGGLAYWVAAVRECFEEAGLLFARRAGSAALLELNDAEAGRLAAWRGRLNRGEAGIAALGAEEGLRLAGDQIVYLSHWVTPPIRAKRFDTRFFIARAPLAQRSLHDDAEMVEQRWVRPADALSLDEASFKLMTPTRKTLELLAHFESAQAVMDWARSPREIPLTMPRMAIGHHGARPVTNDEPAWAEVGRLDPDRAGSAHCEIVAGRAVRLSPRVIRVTAPNPGVMTGPGTNTYLVGGGARNEWVVIDPGPPDSGHVEAILAAAPGRIVRILVTHTHQDHSPAAALLKLHTGAPLAGRLADHREWQDAGFVPDLPLAGGERFELDGATLAVVHTPGHASNHLCYLLEEEKTLFTGDHVMQRSTVVINPPDGDMAAYIASLRRLQELDLDWLAPGHGFLIEQPRRAFELLIRHRQRREAKLVDALRELGPATLDALVVQVYDDVPERMHAMAARSLRAHLEKLVAEGAAAECGGLWGPLRP